MILVLLSVINNFVSGSVGGFVGTVRNSAFIILLLRDIKRDSYLIHHVSDV